MSGVVWPSPLFLRTICVPRGADMARINLTDAFVKALRCERGQKVTEVRDVDVRGLELRVTASGVKTWRLHYTRRSDGRRRAISLGAYPALSLKAARSKAKGLQADIENEEIKADPATDRQIRRRSQTFSEIADEWLDRHGRPNKSPRALRDDISMLDRHIRPRIGAMRVTDITKRDVIRLLDEVAAQPDARKGRKLDRKMTHRPNRVFELVRAIFRWAIGRDLLTLDPTLGVAPPIRKEKPRERDLSPDEIRRLWAALDKSPVGRTPRHSEGNFPMTRPTALAIKLALVTGQRIGEVACIAASELSLDDVAPLWTVPGARTKNGQPNRVPLSPLALKLIAEASELAAESPWLFPSPNGDGPIDPHAPTRALARARDAIGLDDFRIHDLRRTAATRMAELGISPHTISMILNHVSARQGTITSKVYVQYSYDRERREALMAWSARLEEITSTERGHKGPERLLRRSMA
jgi:integrase